jgi:hypothetical protein
MIVPSTLSTPRKVCFQKLTNLCDGLDSGDERVASSAPADCEFEERMSCAIEIAPRLHLRACRLTLQMKRQGARGFSDFPPDRALKCSSSLAPDAHCAAAAAGVLARCDL